MKLNLPAAQAWYLTVFMFHSLCIYIGLLTKSSSKIECVFYSTVVCCGKSFLRIYISFIFCSAFHIHSTTQAHNYRNSTLVLYCIKRSAFTVIFYAYMKVFLRWCVGVHFLVKECVVSWSKRNDDLKKWYGRKCYVSIFFMLKKVCIKTIIERGADMIIQDCKIASSSYHWFKKTYL